MCKNIKHLSLSILMAIIPLYKAQTQNYKIEGNIKGLDTTKGSMYTKDNTAKKGYKLEEVEIKEGNFKHTGEITQAEVKTLSFRSDNLTKRIGRGFIPTKSSMLMYVAYPGAHIKVSGEATDFCNAYPSGDAENDLLAKLNKSIYPLMNEMANYRIVNATDSTLTEEQKKGNKKKAEKLSEQVNKNKIDFLQQHASSVAGLWLMEDMIIRSQIEIEKVVELMQKVDDKYNHLPYYRKLSARVIGYKTTGVGMIAPMVSGINLLDGTEFKIESLRGKYVIIDFWGTWCGACILGVPEMKKFRDKHKEKLQIVGLAKDKNVDKVKKCLDKNSMDWPNILIGEGDQDYVAKYNVQGYPTKILLDQDGKILLRSVGEKDEFYEEVEKLIQKQATI